MTLNPTADTYVEDDTPTTNYGTSPEIDVDASPMRELYLRFDLTGVTGAVQTAKLRLHVENISNGGSPAGGNVARLDNTTWTETGVTWNNRPTTWEPNVESLGAVTQNTWVETDVTAAVAGGAPVTLGLRTTNTDGAYYDSRESANKPQLVLTLGPAAPPVTGPVVAAVGDMVCPPSGAVTTTACRQVSVSNLIVNDPDMRAYLALGDEQYDNGELANFQTAYEASYGRVKAKTHPIPGNHEYNTAGATGYYTYFGAAAGDPTKGYYSFDIGTTWHVIGLNANCTAVACATGSAQEQWLRGGPRRERAALHDRVLAPAALLVGQPRQRRHVRPVLAGAAAVRRGDRAERPRPRLRTIRAPAPERCRVRERHPRVHRRDRRQEHGHVRRDRRGEQRRPAVDVRRARAHAGHERVLVEVRPRERRRARQRHRHLPLTGAPLTGLDPG